MTIAIHLIVSSIVTTTSYPFFPRKIIRSFVDIDIGTGLFRSLWFVVDRGDTANTCALAYVNELQHYRGCTSNIVV
jgi:hypothetical protein